MPLKRILIIIGFIILVMLIGFLLYRLFFTQPPIPQPQPKKTDETTGLKGLDTSRERERKRVKRKEREEKKEGGEEIDEEKKEGEVAPPDLVKLFEPIVETAIGKSGTTLKVTQIQPDQNFSPQLDRDGRSVVTYDNYYGKFYRIEPNGTATQMTEQTFLGAETITWSPKSDKAVIEFLDTTKIIYDFNLKKQIPVPDHWEEIEFAPDGEEIIFKNLTQDPENRWIVIAQGDTSGAQLIEPLGNRTGLFDINWSPSDQVVGIYRKSTDTNRQKLYFIGKNDENFKSVTVNGRDLIMQWSPLGDQLMFSGYTFDNDMKPELWIMDAIGDSIGDNRRRLGVFTWADKCVFADNDILYCAIPQSLKKGAGLMRTIGDAGPDDIYKIHVRTGAKELVASPKTPHAVEKLIISNDQTLLYFNDRETGALYKIEL